MTITGSTYRNEYVADGVLDTFPYTFRILDDAHLAVYVDGVLQTLTTHYTVTGVDVAGGGNVVFGALFVPVVGALVSIIRSVPVTQLTDYVNGDPLDEETMETDFDKMIMLFQQIQEVFDRCPKFGAGSLFKNIAIPDLVASKYLRVNSAGTALQLVDAAPGLPEPVFLDGTTFTGKWYDSSTYASINAAVTAIGATEAVLVVSTAETLAAALTVPANISLVIQKGGSITKDSTYTLTINGPFTAGPYQVFSAFSAGNVTFGAGSTFEVLPEWWGIDGTADDVEIQQAISSTGSTGIPVSLAARTYTLATGITMAASLAKLRGAGRGTILFGDYTGNTPILTVGSAAGRTERQELDGFVMQGTSITVGPNYGLQIIRVTNGRFRHLTCNYIMISPWDIQSVWESHFNDIRAQYVGNGSLTTTGIFWLHPESVSNENTTQNNFSDMVLGSTIGTVFRLAGGTSAISANNFTNFIVESHPTGGSYTSDAAAQFASFDNVTGAHFFNFAVTMNSRINVVTGYFLEMMGSYSSRGVVFANGTFSVQKNGVTLNVPAGFACSKRGSMKFVNVDFNDQSNLCLDNSYFKIDTSAEATIFHRFYFQNCTIYTDKTHDKLFFAAGFQHGTIELNNHPAPYDKRRVNLDVLVKDNAAYATAGTGAQELANHPFVNYALGYTQGLRIRAGGVITGTAGNHTVYLYLSTTQYITIINADAEEGDWWFEGSVIWTAANAWAISWSCIHGSTPKVSKGYSALGASTSAYIVKFVGACSNASDVIAQNFCMAEALDEK